MQRRFFVPHGTSFKIIGVLLRELGAQTADAAVKVALHQRLKGREVAPLVPAEDAVHVDSTAHTIDEVVRIIEDLINQRR